MAPAAPKFVYDRMTQIRDGGESCSIAVDVLTGHAVINVWKSDGSLERREEPCRTKAFAASLGFTRLIIAESASCTLSLLIKPDADLDSTFKAFCTDELEWLDVHGWLFLVEAEAA